MKHSHVSTNLSIPFKSKKELKGTDCSNQKLILKKSFNNMIFDQKISEAADCHIGIDYLRTLTQSRNDQSDSPNETELSLKMLRTC
jgi:hypothetical protein